MAKDNNVEAMTPASMDLTLRLMGRNADETASITAKVMENKQREIDHLTRLVGYLRDKITIACDGPYTPNPIMILNLLYPSELELARYGQED